MCIHASPYAALVKFLLTLQQIPHRGGASSVRALQISLFAVACASILYGEN